MKDMFEFIHNKTVLGFSPDSIAEDAEKRFPAYIAFYKCDKSMVKELIMQLCEYAKFEITRKL